MNTILTKNEPLREKTCCSLSSPFLVESCGILTHHEIAYRAFETFDTDAFGGPGYVRGLMEKHKGREAYQHKLTLSTKLTMTPT